MRANLGIFSGDGRAARIENSIVTTLASHAPLERLYLHGPQDAIDQIVSLAGSRCVVVPRENRKHLEYSHCFEFPDGVPREVRDLTTLLREVYTLRRRHPLSFAIVLDWYKIPDPDIDPHQWPNTEAGNLVHQGKYRQQRHAREQLVEKMASVVIRHPLFSSISAILTVPGSRANYQSFGETLAMEVAAQANKVGIYTISLVGPRQPRKEGGTSGLADAFQVREQLAGDILIVDDVYRTGESMSEVAAAAQKAGASRIFGFAAVRTLRS